MAVIEDVMLEVGRVGLWLQALGIVVIIAIIFDIISFILNKRRLKEVQDIKEGMTRIEGKINKVIEQKK